MNASPKNKRDGSQEVGLNRNRSLATGKRSADILPITHTASSPGGNRFYRKNRFGQELIERIDDVQRDLEI